jgi:D-beta-D-heptose 7-phosphate kinase/D-beta-D-heptose 1-phosphate adenosyltransferase
VRPALGGPRRAPPAEARRKLLPISRLRREIAAARRRGERIVFTNGCFDLLHVGHLRCLERARRLGDRLVVAVNGDASVRRLKGPGRPLVPARQRALLLAALACVDWVVLFRSQTPLPLIRALRPDVLAKGGDWPLEAIAGRAEVLGWGGRVVRLPELRGVRTSRLLALARRRAPISSPPSGRRRGSR